MAKNVFVIILLVFVFIYDLLTPHGMSVSLLYLFPIIIAGLFAGKRFAIAVTGIITIFVIAGYFLASAPKYPVYSEIHRILTLTAGWWILATLLQRKRALNKLAGVNAMLQAIFESAPVAIVALDPEGNVLEWNRGAREIFGYTSEEVKGRHYPLIEGNTEDFKKNFATVLQGESMINLEVSRRKKDGNVIQALASRVPLRDENGKIIGVLATMTDLTEKKRVEMEIEHLNIELATRKAMEQEREDLAAMITHDLKSPLTVITGYAELLLNRESAISTEEKREILATIMHNGYRMQDMVEDYLTVYRSEAGKLQVNLKTEEIADILRELEKDFVPLAEKKKLSLKFAFADTPMAMVDRKQFGRAASNLIQNAIKYTPEGGRILVSLEASEMDFTVTVRDSGPGIRPEERNNIFQKHYRSRMAAGIKGAGLGLAIVKAIAEAHNGEIILESEPSAGSAFKLVIPLRQKNKAA